MTQNPDEQQDENIEVDELEPQGDEPLSPRHRKLAEMLASGAKNKDIEKTLGYSTSRVSILKHSPKIQQEVKRIMDRAFEDGVGSRLRKLAEPALHVIEQAVTDRTNRFSNKEKAEIAKWLLEKVDGKAVQKHEVSGGVLVGVMDKLDALEKSGKGLKQLPEAIDVTPSRTGDAERELTDEEREELEAVERWKDGF